MDYTFSPLVLYVRYTKSHVDYAISVLTKCDDVVASAIHYVKILIGKPIVARTVAHVATIVSKRSTIAENIISNR